MKKLTSVLLVMLFAFSFVTVSFASEQELKITVVSDMHLSLEHSGFNTQEEEKTRASLTEDYATVSSSGELFKESLAINTAFTEKMKTSDCQAVLVTGDLSQNGNTDNHIKMAEFFADIESTGKKVFVTAGNHDLYGTEPEEFKAIYAAFGFDEAIAQDSASLSYVAEIDDDYRLIAVDTTIPGESACSLSETTVEWIKSQVLKAKQDGKKLISVSHHNFMEHALLSSLVQKDSVIDKSLGLNDFYADNGVKYNFTGHTHNSDIMSYTSASGNTYYEASTTSLCLNSCSYREVTFGQEVKFERKTIDEIDSSLIKAETYTAQELECLENDFTQYSKNVYYAGLRRLAVGSVKGAALCQRLNITKENDPEMYEVITQLGDKLAEGLEMPLYIKDETEAGKSIEALVQKYSTTLPASNYTTPVEVATVLYEANTLGDENYPAYSTEIVIFTRALAAVVSYCVEDLNDEQYAQVMSYATKLTGIQLPADLFTEAANGVKRFEGIEILISTAALPIFTDFSVDKTPADNNVVLPGYGQDEKEQTIWEKIMDFFKKIIEAVKTFFAFLPGMEIE